MSCESTTSVISSNLSSDEENECEADVVEPPEVTEPEPEIPEHEEVEDGQPLENCHLSTQSPEVEEKPKPEPVIQTPPKVVEKQVLQERKSYIKGLHSQSSTHSISACHHSMAGKRNF
jgi:hypothetical protein